VPSREEFFEIGSLKLFDQVGFQPDPPDLCFLCSWDYRREPGFIKCFLTRVPRPSNREKDSFFQQTMAGKLDIHMQKSETNNRKENSAKPKAVSLKRSIELISL
jgi:hypothetical protein